MKLKSWQLYDIVIQLYRASLLLPGSSSLYWYCISVIEVQIQFFSVCLWMFWCKCTYKEASCFCLFAFSNLSSDSSSVHNAMTNVHKLKTAGYWCIVLLSKCIYLLIHRAAKNQLLWEMLRMYHVVIFKAYGVTLLPCLQQTTRMMTEILC